MQNGLAVLAIAMSLGLYVGCSSAIQPIRSSPAQIVEYRTESSEELLSLPPPKEPIVVTVYKFRDQTGQYKPGLGTTGWSTAVTQGATSMVIKAMQDAGRGSWFSVLERESLSDLLNERRIIRQTREEYKGPEQESEKLPPLLYAPVFLNGGIIAYETDLLTGGMGARFLGIGASTEYRRDTVTIYVRLISVKNGRVLHSVTTSKTIFSIGLDAGVFKFVDVKKLLEVEAGFTTNEPPQMAVLEAIEKAVYSLVVEGASEGLWAFRDRAAGEKIIASYREALDAQPTPKLAEEEPPLAPAAAPRPRRTATGPGGDPPRATGAPEVAPAAPPALAAAAPPPTVPEKQPQAPPPRKPRGVNVQLAATKTADGAQRAWDELSRRHSDLLASLSPIVVRADPEAKSSFYRLQAALGDPQGARRLCEALGARGADCFVTAGPEAIP